MILLLDVISSIPEFSIIQDKKIIFSCKIIHSVEEKLSDSIIPKYLEINKSSKLEKNLKAIIITIGPGSYTSLRVGAAFAAGLQFSKNLKVASVSSETISKFLINDNNKNKEGIYIKSGYSQNFISFEDNKKIFKNYKINIKDFNLPKDITKLYFNEKPLKNNSRILKNEKFILKETILSNLNKIKFSYSDLIKPHLHI